MLDYKLSLVLLYVLKLYTEGGIPGVGKPLHTWSDDQICVGRTSVSRSPERLYIYAYTMARAPGRS